jgi:integrase
MADRTLAIVRKAFNWHSARDDHFVVPIAKGMAKTKPRERRGKRVLSDDEIREIWSALNTAEVPAPFPRLLRTLFVTAVRRSEAARGSWDEVHGDLWTIPEERMKAKLPHVVPLTPSALALIGEKPPKAGPFIFSTDNGKTAFSGYSKAKAALDAEIAKLRKAQGKGPMPPWTMSRDVRRTCRTLMSRAGVPSDHAERVLAHVIPGVEGVYDMWEYLPEKREALAKLAGLIGEIVHD